MATKLSFRARALDSTKPLPVYRSEDEPDILKEAAISRGVMEMATGMEKEEEEEVHIRQAIQQENPLENAVVIPIPEASSSADVHQAQKEKFSLPKQYIRTHVSYGLDDEVPEYDMDSEDEAWLEEYNTKHKKEPSVTPDKFELIFGRIEALMKHGPVQPQDLASIAGDEADLYKTILEHAKTRTSELKRPTVTPLIKMEKPDGSSVRDPYVAFRARTEKMQTRKSQKNQEASYVNMLKLHRDMIRCRDIIERVKMREMKKAEYLRTREAIMDARFSLKDWTGAIVTKCAPQPVITMRLPVVNQPTAAGDAPSALTEPRRLLSKDQLPFPSAASSDGGASASRVSEKESRKGKGKRKWEDDSPSVFAPPSKFGVVGTLPDDSIDIDDDDGSSESSAVTEDEYDHDEPFRLRRRFNMFYHAPLSELPHRASSTGQYQLARRPNMDPQPRPVVRGFCRRRIGRGGRIFIDRCRPDFDFQDELTRVTNEQEEDLRLQQAKLQDYYAQRQREQQVRRQRDASSTGAAGPAPSSARTPTAATPTTTSEGAAAAAVNDDATPMGARGTPGSSSAGPSSAGAAAALDMGGPATPSTPTISEGGAASPSTAAVGGRRAAKASSNPYAKSYASGGRDRLPPAGADFGSGGENVNRGPFVRLVGQPIEGQGASGWMPVSDAVATKQAAGPGGVRLAPSPTKSVTKDASSDPSASPDLNTST
eukprot:m.104765 g.104765  ORF g.104765 m.104765 type:complete len:711 (-) comp10535_c0_seq1:162-2294(-)